jgi:hypothetical protein
MSADRLYTLTTKQLAERLQTNPGSIRSYRSGIRRPPVLIGLPEPIQTQPRLLWLTADIEAWINTKRTFKPDQAPAPAAQPEPQPARRRGRPRKSTPVGEKGGAA